MLCNEKPVAAVVFSSCAQVEPGGELYPLDTPLRELGDFGLGAQQRAMRADYPRCTETYSACNAGVGLYFSSRVAMVIMFSLIGISNCQFDARNQRH